MKMEEEMKYEAPEVLLLLTEVECGFADSDPAGNPGGKDGEDAPSLW